MITLKFWLYFRQQDYRTAQQIRSPTTKPTYLALKTQFGRPCFNFVWCVSSHYSEISISKRITLTDLAYTSQVTVVAYHSSLTFLSPSIIMFIYVQGKAQYNITLNSLFWFNVARGHTDRYKEKIILLLKIKFVLRAWMSTNITSESESR